MCYEGRTGWEGRRCPRNGPLRHLSASTELEDISKASGRKESKRTCVDGNDKHPIERAACRGASFDKSYESQKGGRSSTHMISLANVDPIAASSFARQPRRHQVTFASHSPC
jgi:hypothetical protein